MFVKKGSTRIVRCYPLLGIVIKLPTRKYFGVKFSKGMSANKAESNFWRKTHHKLLAPVLFSFFGLFVIMPYYSKSVRKDSSFDSKGLPDFYQTVRNILGKEMFYFWGRDPHDTEESNFKLNSDNKLVMIDYGITNPNHHQKFLEFLEEHGDQLVSEYTEPSNKN